MRFGILGWGKIARTALAPAMAESGHELVAVGSRTPQATHLPEQAAVRWLDYEALVNDPAVEAVYIALPNHLHVPWTLRALAAGKHVLCEKPMALQPADIEHVQQAARDARRLVQEAFMVRHHPQWQRLRELELGPVRQIQVSFAYDNRDAANIRNRADWGGGALWDIGCYAVLAGHWLLSGEPVVCQLNQRRHPEWGTDIDSHGQLVWADGAVLQFSVSTQAMRQQTLRVVGERGWARLDVPFNPPPTTTITRQLAGEEAPVVEALPPVNQYAHMVDQFARAASTGAATQLQDSLQIARTLERLWAAARAV